MIRATPCVLTCLLAALAPLRAEDWPCWRGPQRNGISREKGWLDRWPADGPPIAWKAGVGVGFAAASVSGGRLVTVGHQDGRDVVTCLDAVTGKKLWSHSYEAALGDRLFEGGPTATPAVDGDRVYTLSRWGHVFCLEAATGKVVWSKNVQEETEAPIPSWGFSGSPTVHGDVLLLNVGEAGMALDRRTGKTLWTSEKNEAGYSTPLPLQRDGEWLALVSSGTGYTAVSVKTGKPKWFHRWVTRYGVNSTDPIVAGDRLFLSTGYSKGATLLRLGEGDPVEVWRSRALRTQLNTAVLLDGFVYGIDGDTTGEASLKCIELETGRVRWTQEGIGSGSVLASDGKLIVLSEQGELLVAPASPEKFAPTARARVLEGKCWTVPVLANGRIYCRSATGDLVCVDVRADRTGQ